MLKGKTIFILGATNFDGIFESTSFNTAKYLAKDNDVYYLDFPFTIKDYFNAEKSEAIAKRKPFFKSSSNGLLRLEMHNLNVIILPLLLSINFLPEGKLYRLLLKYNERLIAKRLKKILSSISIKDVIFINSFNFHYPNIGKLINAAVSVYHCVDPLIIGYDMKHGVVSENILVRDSDLVICTSRQLYREKKLINENTFFIPNAADITLSSKALDPALEIHAVLHDIPKPIVGFFGHVERRMDYDLLTQVAAENPEKSFVFVGPVSEEFVPEYFKKLENIYFVGRVPYLEMPMVLKGFDIAIIPFKKDQVSSTIFPLKLFEYLGAGKPVILTDFNPDLKEFTEDCVYYCNSSGSFTKAINDCLKNDSPELIEKRRAIAEINTWDNRLLEMSNLISSNYLTKCEL
ncbi:MAG: glycosyltransferase [Bacteroidota bacterium]